MISVKGISVVFFCLVYLCQFCFAASKPESFARKEDIPFIKCQVCEKIASQIYSQVEKKEAHISPKKISELHIIEIAENICNLKKEEGDWISRIDIVEKGNALQLVEQNTEGECRSECKTIQRACQEVLDYADTDVAEFLFTNKPSIGSLTNFLCEKTTRICSKELPPVPRDRVPGEAFQPKSHKEAEMEKILRSMQDMPGAPNMKMYSREDLMSGDFGNEDDEDDEDQFPSNVGKLMKEPPKDDWKQSLVKRIKGKSQSVRTRVSGALKRLWRWWRQKRVSKPSKKTDL